VLVESEARVHPCICVVIVGFRHDRQVLQLIGVFQC
jgi:hypothetical protein